MSEIVAVVLDTPEGDASQSMDFDHILHPVGRRADVDVGFFACANARAGAEQGIVLQVCVEGEVIKSSVGQTVAVVLCILGARNQIGFGERGNGFVNPSAAAAARAAATIATASSIALVPAATATVAAAGVKI